MRAAHPIPENAEADQCRHSGAALEANADEAHAHAYGGAGGPLITAAQATLHCLTGCIIGQVAGLAIGVTLGLGVWPMIALATTLASISGFALGVVPVMRRQKKSFRGRPQAHPGRRGDFYWRHGSGLERRGLTPGAA